jgi:hypothetical protein
MRSSAIAGRICRRILAITLRARVVTVHVSTNQGKWPKGGEGLESRSPNNMVTAGLVKAAPKLAFLCYVYARSYSIGSRAKGRAAAKSLFSTEIINNRLPVLWPSTCSPARLYIQKKRLKSRPLAKARAV